MSPEDLPSILSVEEKEMLLAASNSTDFYSLTGDTLGEGAYAWVQTCMCLFEKGLGERGEIPSLMFDKLRGGPLLRHIEQPVQFAEYEASRVARGVAEALRFLHSKGIAHRDLKPENILYPGTDQVWRVKISDLNLGFGVVLPSGNQKTPPTTPELQAPAGSAEFMAPNVTHVGGANQTQKHFSQVEDHGLFLEPLCR
ncbi:hypothetical protein HPB48_016246 [Haemaphysalis longicornis]|uniref:Protein kinase domain-containing protein n=1 Tax=Haemaphysalis longicornis TaxID=44386 RepID=A0A9J6GF28_HAELO|nr:hypothetical protein HPB48_016246 [Haemaphysalis longicornis]